MKDVKLVAGYIGWMVGVSIGITIVSAVCQKAVEAVFE